MYIDQMASLGKHASSQDKWGRALFFGNRPTLSYCSIAKGA